MYTPKKKMLLTVCETKITKKKSFNQQRSKKTIKTRRKCKPNKAHSYTQNTQHIYIKNVSKSQNKLSEREKENKREVKAFPFRSSSSPAHPSSMDGWMDGCGDDRREMCYLYLEFLNKVLVTCAVIAASAWQVRLTLWGGFRKH